MGETTAILWTDKTFNPWEGCQKVGPGCDHCYAEARNARFGGGAAANWGPGAPRRRTSKHNWNAPLRWNREAEDAGRRFQVFCASLADVFDKAAPIGARDDLWSTVSACGSLDWQIVTKRVGNVESMVPDSWRAYWPANIWLIITVTNQAEANRDIPKLLDLKRRFGISVVGLSIEPMLGPIDLSAWIGQLDWVICGGESGPGARPMHSDWVRNLRDLCVPWGVAFFFKQWGEFGPCELHPPGRAPLSVITFGGKHLTGRAALDEPSERDAEIIGRFGRALAGRLLDGVEHNDRPHAMGRCAS